MSRPRSYACAVELTLGATARTIAGSTRSQEADTEESLASRARVLAREAGGEKRESR
jgi:hypothetical protein